MIWIQVVTSYLGRLRPVQFLVRGIDDKMRVCVYVIFNIAFGSPVHGSSFNPYAPFTIPIKPIHIPEELQLDSVNSNLNTYIHIYTWIFEKRINNFQFYSAVRVNLRVAFYFIGGQPSNSTETGLTEHLHLGSPLLVRFGGRGVGQNLSPQFNPRTYKHSNTPTWYKGQLMETLPWVFAALQYF